jgi:hypothetical protein
MGKAKKEHRKKIAKRNAEIKTQQKKQQKQAQEFLMNLIQKEKAAGAFDGTPIKSNDEIIIGAPSPILTDLNGPII